MKKYLILIIVLKIIKKIFCEEVGNNVLAVNNECSSLGINNPLKARDCQVYEFTKKYCCMLSITYKHEDSDDEVKTSCIKLDSISNSAKTTRVNYYKELFSNYSIDVLIECYGRFITKNIYINILLILLLF